MNTHKHETQMTFLQKIEDYEKSGSFSDFLECADIAFTSKLDVSILIKKWEKIEFKSLKTEFSIYLDSWFLSKYTLTKVTSQKEKLALQLPFLVNKKSDSFSLMLKGLNNPDSKEQCLDRYPFFRSALDVEPFLSEHYSESQNPARTISLYLQAIFEEPLLPSKDSRVLLEEMQTRRLFKLILSKILEQLKQNDVQTDACRLTVELLSDDNFDSLVKKLRIDYKKIVDAWKIIRSHSNTYSSPVEAGDMASCLFNIWFDFWHLLWDKDRTVLAETFRLFLESDLMTPEETVRVFSSLIIATLEFSKQLSFSESANWRDILANLQVPAYKAIVRLHQLAEEFNGCRSYLDVDSMNALRLFSYVHLNIKDEKDEFWMSNFSMLCLQDKDEEFGSSMYSDEREFFGDRFYWYSLVAKHARRLALPELENAFISFFLYSQHLKFGRNLGVSPRVLSPLIERLNKQPGRELLSETLKICSSMNEVGQVMVKSCYGGSLDRLLISSFSSHTNESSVNNLRITGLSTDADYVLANLRRRYGDAFSNRLSPETQKMFVQAEIDSANLTISLSPEERNYAILILSHINPIEMELKFRLGQYFESGQIGNDKLLNATSKRIITLGSFLKVLSGHCSDEVDILLKNAGIDVSKSRYVWKRLEPLVYRYRNPAAHGENIGMKKYAEFRSLLFGGNPNLFEDFLQALSPLDFDHFSDLPGR